MSGHTPSRTDSTQRRKGKERKGAKETLFRLCAFPFRPSRLRVESVALGAAAALLVAGIPMGAGAQQPAAAPRNVVFILSDDHRFDFMGFHPDAPEWLETPSLDRMAREGAHLANAFVTTALCSPSRASMRATSSRILNGS
mgnify:CR=1 FL=1